MIFVVGNIELNNTQQCLNYLDTRLFFFCGPHPEVCDSFLSGHSWIKGPHVINQASQVLFFWTLKRLRCGI